MNRFDRQSFLGARSESILDGATVGFVGLGGGGSYFVQEASHLGIGGYVLVDPDYITSTNTNRLIGGTLDDVVAAMPKVQIATRLIQGLHPAPRISVVRDSWHAALDQLKTCNIIVGAVDSYREREQLERFARIHLIPYIDIGMDVHHVKDDHFLIAGQVFLSMPTQPCLRCCGIVTDDNLEEEANQYGAAGSRPQVVWANGVLASIAIGLMVQLLTPWYPDPPEFVYLHYDGNRGTVTPNRRMTHPRGDECPHHPLCEVGDQLLDVRNF